MCFTKLQFFLLPKRRISFNFIHNRIYICIFCLSLPQTAPLFEVRYCVVVYNITAWRTTCLYGVSYSRASPRLLLGVTFSVSETDSTVSDVRVGRVISCHRKAYYVLVRCLNGIIIRLFLPCLKTILIKTLVIQKFFLPLQCPFAHVA